MLPCQGRVALRTNVTHLLRFYQQQSASLSAGVVKPKSHFIKQSSEMAFLASVAAHTSSLFEKYSCLHLCADSQTTSSFTTSCSLCYAVQKQSEDADKKLLQFEDDKTMKQILGMPLNKLMKLAATAETGFQACLVLQRLCQFYKSGKTHWTDGETLLSDPKLRKVLKKIDVDVAKVTPRMILSTLQELYSVTATDVYVTESLQKQILWLIRRMPIALLIQVLEVHLGHQETSHRKSVMQQTLAVVERRWLELTNPKDIISLMYTVQDQSHVAQTLMERLKDRALDVVEKASPKELYRLLYLLSRQRHRLRPLIVTVVYHLNETSLSSLSAVQLTNLTYALCVLNVYDMRILSKVATELIEKQAQLTGKLASSLLVSFSRLRWKESGVIQMLLNLLEKKLSLSTQHSSSSSSSLEQQQMDESEQKSDAGFLDVSDKVGLVLSLANMNVDSAQSRAFVERIVRSLDTESLRHSSPLMWLDVVWSLAVLQMLDAESASSVLAEDFWGNLPSSESFQSRVNMTKVNNINCAATYELEGYTGPFLPASITSGGDAKLLQKGERKVAETLVSAVRNMAPQDSHSRSDTTAFGGYFIDAEFCTDSSGGVRPLHQGPDLPADCHRMAMKVLDFADLTLPNSDLTGLNAMAVRHLRHQGYTVMSVKHTEVSSKSTVVGVVQMLQKMVKNTLNPLPVQSSS